MILAGDVGGTKTNLAFFESSGGRLVPRAEATFQSRDFASLDELVMRFVTEQRVRVRHAAFGVAGPVKSGRCETTNLAWIVDAAVLASKLDIGAVTLLNDLEASAHGIGELAPSDFFDLNPRAAGAPGNAAVVAAGTGLGEAGLFWDGRRHVPFASEGGHADFAPTSEIEEELLRWLRRRFEHVSYERILSGPGLVNVHEFLRDRAGAPLPSWLAEQMKSVGGPAAVSRAALEKTDPICAQALDLFVSIYGAESGNLALKVMAIAGVYLGGGIAPKIVEKLRDGTFLRAFAAKGRMKELLESVPVRVVLNDKAALLGAARCAAVRQARR
jgi:glucokinase